MPISLHSWSILSQRGPLVGTPLLQWEFTYWGWGTQYVPILKSFQLRVFSTQGGPGTASRGWRVVLQARRELRKGMSYAKHKCHRLWFHPRVPSSFQERLYRVGHLSGPNTPLLPDILEIQPISRALSSSAISATAFLASFPFIPPGFSAKMVFAPPATSGSVPMRWPCGWKTKCITWNVSSVPPVRNISVSATDTSSSTPT